MEKHLQSKTEDPLNQLFLKGKIPEEIRQIAQPILLSITKEQVEKNLEEIVENEELIKEQAFAKETLKKMQLNDKIIPPAARLLASYAMAELEFVKQTLFPTELETSRQEINFIQQPGYHIDLFICPGPKGSLFVQDYLLALEVLATIKAKEKQLNLSESEIQQLDSFIKTTSEICRDLDPMMKTLQSQLENAGFIVIPTPGAFFGYAPNDPTEETNINFINSITGFSPQNDHYYYITAGAQGHLGRILMDVFAEFIHSQCENTVVYYTGRKRSDLTNFEEAQLHSNSDNAFGPHCLANELKTGPHSTA